MPRPRRNPRRRDAHRVRLWVEPLEGREVPAGIPPDVFGPGFQIVPEGQDLGFAFAFGSMSGGPTFAAFDMDDAGGTYTADIIVTDPGGNFVAGTLAANGPPTGTLLISGDGSSRISLTGGLSAINAYLQDPGFRYNSGFYSGDAEVTVTVTDPESNTGSATATVAVTPVASPPLILADPTAPVPLGPGLGPLAGLFALAPLPDTDGSEEIGLTVEVIGQSDTSGFLFAGPVSPTGTPGVFAIGPVGSAAELQALLGAITLTPPPGFSGAVSLRVSVTVTDTANIGSLETTLDSSAGAAADVPLRFFTDARAVTVPSVTVPKGSPVDLGGGRIAVADADFQSGDMSVLTLAVPVGTLTVAPPGASGPLSVVGSGTGTVTLVGDLGVIAALLAAPGSLQFDPPGPTFSGGVPLAATLALIPAAPNTGIPARPAPALAAPAPPTPAVAFGLMALTPAAGPVVLAPSDVTTDEDTPVALALGLVAFPDPDGSEAVTVRISGVPGGATFSAGNDLGGGVWEFAPAELVGLIFTPPEDFAGTITLTVDVVAVDAAPDLGLADTETGSAAFRVVVTPVADPPDVSADDADGAEGDDIPLAITAAATDDDGSESVSIRIQGLPSGFTLSAGTFDASTGDWVLTADDLDGLTVFAPAGSGGQGVTVTVAVTSTESANGSTSTATAAFTLTVRAAAAPPADTTDTTATPATTQLFADFLEDAIETDLEFEAEDEADVLAGDAAEFDSDTSDAVAVDEVQLSFVSADAGFIPPADTGPGRGARGAGGLAAVVVQSFAAANAATFAAERGRLVPTVRPLDPTHFAAPPDGLQGDNLRWLDDLIRGYQSGDPAAPVAASADGPRSDAVTTPPAESPAADPAPPADEPLRVWRWLAALGVVPLMALSWWAVAARLSMHTPRPARPRREDAR